MRYRCSNPARKDYPHYGGRGITICERWLGADGFDNFVADMGERPENKSLDRKDNNRGYSPYNCRWATKMEQMANRRTYKTSTSGTKGVIYQQSGKYSGWVAQFQRNGKRVGSKMFKTKEEAVAERRRLELIV